MNAKNFTSLALVSFGNSWSITDNDYNTLVWSAENTQAKPTLAQLTAKIDELKLAEPLRLLREQRDTIHLPAWDKEVQIKFLNNNLPIPQNYLDWKQAYLDLPQNIAAGTIPAPTLDVDGNLVFNDWPVLV